MGEPRSPLLAETDRSAVELPYLAELLNLVPAGVIVRQFAGDEVIYWSRGAEVLYGWSPTEALGQVTHELLRTQFPDLKEAVDAALSTSGQWSGELVHRGRDGEQIVVASRQAVQRDTQGRPIA